MHKFRNLHRHHNSESASIQVLKYIAGSAYYSIKEKCAEISAVNSLSYLPFKQNQLLD